MTRFGMGSAQPKTVSIYWTRCRFGFPNLIDVSMAQKIERPADQVSIDNLDLGSGSILLLVNGDGAVNIS